MTILLFSLLLLSTIAFGLSAEYTEDETPTWARKDFTADLIDEYITKLLELYQKDDDELSAEDELPQVPKIDLTKIKLDDPKTLLEATKKGLSLMTFVSVSGSPSRHETERLTKLWQTTLWDNQIQAERYVVDDKRAIFLFKDGTQAWTAKEYLVGQKECESVTIEGTAYPGKKSGKAQEEL